jgi:hypothetical protein
MVENFFPQLTFSSPSVSQWAETQSTALGLGRFFPSAFMARVKELSSTAFMGEPWPMKTAGILSLFVTA